MKVLTHYTTHSLSVVRMLISPNLKIWYLAVIGSRVGGIRLHTVKE